MLADLVPPLIVKSLTDVIPLRRMTEASEVARLVLFLASDASPYITGAEHTSSTADIRPADLHPEGIVIVSDGLGHDSLIAFPQIHFELPIGL